MRRSIVPLLLLTLVPQAAVLSQGSEIPRGALIRVSAPMLGQRPVKGQYSGLIADSLSFMPVRTSELAQIPLSQVLRLEVSDGPNRAAGAVLGAITGFAGFVAGGFLCLVACLTSADDGANLAPLGGLIFGVVLGLPVGAALGGTVFAPHSWRQVPVPANR
jgi:hypothetical protein